MIILKKYILIISIAFLLSSCAILPGVNDGPQSRESKLSTNKDYSIEDVKIDIIKINSLTENDFNILNQNNIEELNFKIDNFTNIYNYRYEYILGPADIISINLTDTDDIDNSYEIDPDGMIDVPFIGKIKIDGFTVDEAQNILKEILGNLYKNFGTYSYLSR